MMQVRTARRLRFAAAAPLWMALALLVPHVLHAQTEAWRAHTSMREVVALDAGEETIWAATSGGIFSYHLGSGELRLLTAADGLHNVATQALAYDVERGVVWSGYQSGVIDRIDVETGAVESFRDIARATQFSTRAVQRLVLLGDSLFVGTSFGLVVFDPDKAEVRDSYTRFGTFPAATTVYDVAIAPGSDGAPRLWVATSEGVAHAPLDASNLKVPDVWTTESVGPERLEVLAIERYDGAIYVGTEENLWRREPDGGYTSMQVVGRPITDLTVRDDALLGTYTFGLVRVRNGEAAGYAGPGNAWRPYRLVTAGDGSLWVGGRTRGLLGVTIVDGDVEVEREVLPDGPYLNAFNSLAVGEDGTLWAAGSRGFYRLDPEEGWTNYNPESVEALDGVGFSHDVLPTGQGEVWVGTRGRGAVLMSDDGTFHRFDHTNSSLAAPTYQNTDESYVIVESIDVDAEGNVWAANKAAPRPLQVYVPDGEPSGDNWYGLLPHLGQDNTYGRLLIDSFGQKWVQVIRRQDFGQSPGVAVIDTGADPTSAADDSYRFFNEEGSGGVGLPSTHVLAITEDRDGLIWVGTEEGPAYLFNTGIVPSDPNAQFIRPQLADREEDESVFLLNGVAVNDIAVDPANRLWMATEEGAYLVAPDGGGYRIVHHFTADNSPLFDDTVQRVAIDPTTGRVYLATEFGLVSYASSAIEPEEQVQDLFVYPNPVLFVDDEVPDVCVRGLVEETDVQVLTPDGALVTRSQEASGQFCWRGADADVWYRDVPSGVYIIAAVGRNGEGTAFGRVAVVR